MNTVKRSMGRHGIRIVVIWLVACAISIPLLATLVKGTFPPGRMTVEAGSQRDFNAAMTVILDPIILLVLITFVYSIVVFRERGDGSLDGPPIRGHALAQTSWVVLSTAIVLALAIWGSYTLVEAARGAGGGQGPTPTSSPKGAKRGIQVQVIGQQWAWTFRFPQYGGFETQQLEIPVNTVTAFHVTSLDVTHSFWAYQLGVKADAVPGVDNIAYATPRHKGRFEIRCAELCGLWHGHMAKHGRVVSGADFKRWVTQQKAADELNVKDLGPYTRAYYPEPKHRAG